MNGIEATMRANKRLSKNELPSLLSSKSKKITNRSAKSKN
jgi:hypothetical protein